MPVYKYDARDHAGKSVRGTVEAGSEREASGLVREKGLFLTRLAEIKKNTFTPSLNFLIRITFSDIAAFTRQLSTMATAGLQIPEALNLLKTQSWWRDFSECPS